MGALKVIGLWFAHTLEISDFIFADGNRNILEAEEIVHDFLVSNLFDVVAGATFSRTRLFKFSASLISLVLALSRQRFNCYLCSALHAARDSQYADTHNARDYYMGFAHKFV